MVRVHVETARGNELPIDAEPAVAIPFGADAERRDLLVTVLANAAVGRSQQNVREVGGAEALAGAVDIRKSFSSFCSAVIGLDRIRARIAVPAALTSGFAKIM